MACEINICVSYSKHRDTRAKAVILVLAVLFAYATWVVNGHHIVYDGPIYDIKFLKMVNGQGWRTLYM